MRHRPGLLSTSGSRRPKGVSEIPFVEWSEVPKVEVAEIDAEHAELIRLLNGLFDAMKAGRGRDRVGSTLDGLAKYTRTHFQNEERLMRIHGYPEIEAHRAQHAALLEQIASFRTKLKDDGASLTISLDLLDFLKSWLIEHIETADAKLGAHLHSKTGSTA